MYCYSSVGHKEVIALRYFDIYARLYTIYVIIFGICTCCIHIYMHIMHTYVIYNIFKYMDLSFPAKSIKSYGEYYSLCMNLFYSYFLILFNIYVISYIYTISITNILFQLLCPVISHNDVHKKL